MLENEILPFLHLRAGHLLKYLFLTKNHEYLQSSAFGYTTVVGGLTQPGHEVPIKAGWGRENIKKKLVG